MASELSLEAPDKSFVGFRLSLVYFASYHFFLYRSYTSQDCTVLDSIEKILSLSLRPSANILSSVILMHTTTRGLNIPKVLMLPTFKH